MKFAQNGMDWILIFGGYSVDLYLVALTLVGSWLLQKFAVKQIIRLVQRKNLLKSGQAILLHLKWPLFALFVLTGIAYSVTSIFEITRRLYIIVVIWLLIEVVEVFTAIASARFDITQSDNLAARKARTRIIYIERTINYLLVFIGVALILMTFSEVRTLGRGLIASAGLAGVVIGFAAQKTLGTFAAGFQVAFTQPIRIDDVVVVEGEWGTIEEITLTYVVIKIWDLRRLIVPINYFTDKPFQNWTRTEAALLGYVFLNFDYALNIDDLRTEFMKLLRANTLWDGKVGVVQVTDATEKTMQVRLLMSARNSPEAFDLRCEIREKMIAYVQKTSPDSLPMNRARLIG